MFETPNPSSFWSRSQLSVPQVFGNEKRSEGRNKIQEKHTVIRIFSALTWENPVMAVTTA
jgi:hypothetical protein